MSTAGTLGTCDFLPVTPSVLETSADPVVVGGREIAAVVAAARTAPNGRARLILHPGPEDSLHEMIIALPSTSCDHPHINFRSGKSFLALSGRFAVMSFAEDGSDVTTTVLSAGPWAGARLVRLRDPRWHTIIPLDGDTVFLETIIGPFEGNRWAPWFPDDCDFEGRQRAAERLRKIAAEAAAQLKC